MHKPVLMVFLYCALTVTIVSVCVAVLQSKPETSAGHFEVTIYQPVD